MATPAELALARWSAVRTKLASWLAAKAEEVGRGGRVSRRVRPQVPPEWKSL